MLTTDFSGSYDYEREEASDAAAYFLGLLDDMSDEEARAYVMRESSHWRHVLDPDGYMDFMDEWGKHVPAIYHFPT